MRHLLSYSLLALPLAFAGLPIYVHAPDFYASHYGVSLASLGVVLLGLRVFDAIQDPFIGSVSDRWHQQRTFIMAGGMLLLAGGLWLLFHPQEKNLILMFALGILLCTTGFSIVSINFQALGGLWRSDSAGRSRITSWREAVGLTGLLLASIAPTLLHSHQNAPLAFHTLTLLYLPLLALCALVFFHWMKHADIESPRAHTPASFRQLCHRWHLQFFALYLCNNFASALPATLVVFFVKDRLQAGELLGVFLLAYFLSGVCGMPFWQWLAKTIGKTRAWMVSMWLATITFIWAFTLSAGDSYAYGIICMLSGLALGADLALPPAIIADHIAHKKDYHLASRYFSIMTFLAKSSLALATGLALPALGMLGYQPSAVSDYRITDYLSYSYALIPSILKAGVALWLWRFIQKERAT